MDARLVVLGIDHPYSKEPDNPAEAAAKAIFRFVRRRAGKPGLGGTIIFGDLIGKRADKPPHGADLRQAKGLRRGKLESRTPAFLPPDVT
jgi:hypothetical protein